MSVFSLVKTLAIENIFLNKMENKLEECYIKQRRINK
jgi:hypothetical protein